jgi:hypothetical protein
MSPHVEIIVRILWIHDDDGVVSSGEW